jgi:hypothetical protein
VGAQQQERGEGERRGRSGPGGGGRRIDRLIGFPDGDGFVVVGGGGGSPLPRFPPRPGPRASWLWLGRPGNFG